MATVPLDLNPSPCPSAVLPLTFAVVEEQAKPGQASTKKASKIHEFAKTWAPDDFCWLS